MEAGTYNFTIQQGSSWSRLMVLKISAVVVDLSTYLARMTIRRTYGSAAILSLTSGAGGGIVLAATSPNITVTMTPAQTAALDFEYAIYDLEIESASGTIDTLLIGRVTLRKQVAL